MVYFRKELAVRGAGGPHIALLILFGWLGVHRLALTIHVGRDGALLICGRIRLGFFGRHMIVLFLTH